MQQLDFILQAINENLNPIKIILFGSQAKGNAHKNSDIDIAVIQKEKPSIDDKVKFL